MELSVRADVVHGVDEMGMSTERQPASSDERLPEDAITDAAIEHADRWWRAECENANRLAGQVNFMLTGLVALVGLGLFRIEWRRREDDVSMISPVWAIIVIRAFLTLAILAFVWSFWRLRPTDRRDRTLQSEKLQLPERLFLKPGRSRLAVFVTVYRASLGLWGRNVAKLRRIEAAQLPFLIGLVLVIASIVLYLWTSHPFWLAGAGG